jgi:hypothetical protein
MDKADGIGDKRRHPRFPIKGRVRARTGDVEYEGRLKDVSGGGALLDLGQPFENDLFVELHLEGLGRLPARTLGSFGELEPHRLDPG